MSFWQQPSLGDTLNPGNISSFNVNLPIVQAWASQSSKHPGIMELLRMHSCTAQLHRLPGAPPRMAELHRRCPVTQPHGKMFLSCPSGTTPCTSNTSLKASRALEDRTTPPCYSCGSINLLPPLLGWNPELGISPSARPLCTPLFLGPNTQSPYLLHTTVGHSRPIPSRCMWWQCPSPPNPGVHHSHFQQLYAESSHLWHTMLTELNTPLAHPTMPSWTRC